MLPFIFEGKCIPSVNASKEHSNELRFLAEGLPFPVLWSLNDIQLVCCNA